jgi:Leucine-rich repeat (LRR) protein
VCTLSCDAASCSEGPPGSSCIEPTERAHERFCAGRDAPALCLVPCEGDECTEGFSCRESVCLPDAVAALTPGEPNPSAPADAGVEPLPPLSLCTNDPVAWRSVAVADQRGYDALEGCERVDGDLRITVSNDGDLGPLRSLRVVTGMLTIVAAEGLDVRATLPGLENLEHAGGLLLSLPLSSLDTFAQLRSIGPALPGAMQRGSLILGTGVLRDLSGLALEEVDSITAESEPLESLTGLGSARVRSLYISYAAIEDLGGLEAVTGIEEITLVGNEQLTSLRGLPASSSLQRLSVESNPSLTSLDGLVVPSEMRALTLSSSPISDITALGTLTSVTDSLLLFGISLENLEALTNLRSVTQLTISNNPELAQVEALGGLSAMSGLEVSSNASLLLLPEMPGINDPLGVSITDNPLLASGPSFPALTQASTITLTDNPVLTSVDGFGALQQVGSLVIARNAGLLELDLPALADVESRLEIRGNGALPSSQLDALRELPLAGVEVYLSTADAPALLDPCPFLGDVVCDEASGDCAPGTDFGDCPNAGDP